MRPRLRVHTTTDRARPVLVWRAPRPTIVASSAPFGGGIALRSWIVNAEVPRSYDRIDLADHARELKDELELVGDGVVMLTATTVERHRSAEVDGVLAVATVGLSRPVFAADDDSLADRGAGTINVVVWVPARLALAALVGAVATATEAKVQALVEHEIPGTGTATDAVAIACPAEGPVEPFAGVRSMWGARIARAVHGAVSAGC